MAIEIYNKPTIRYRVEGFSFFICNAWELMLKARMIKTYFWQLFYSRRNYGRILRNGFWHFGFIPLNSNEFVVVIEFNMLEYRKKHNSKAVKKTLTIPQWLNEAAIERNINFSQVLQEALILKCQNWCPFLIHLKLIKTYQNLSKFYIINKFLLKLLINLLFFCVFW